jgi:hypothetical protein
MVKNNLLLQKRGRVDADDHPLLSVGSAVSGITLKFDLAISLQAKNVSSIRPFVAFDQAID